MASREGGQSVGIGEFDPGSSYLCLGPPFVGKRRAVLSWVADAYRDGGTVLIVSGRKGAGKLHEEFAELVGSSTGERFGVVDCAPGSDDGGGPSVRSVTSPADLTGVGIALSDLVEAVDPAEGAGRYLVFDSLSTFVTYAGFDRVSRFLNVVIGRLGGAGTTSFFLLEGATLGEGELATVESVFDGRVEFRESEDRREARVIERGGGGDWRPIDVSRPEREGGARARDDAAAVAPVESLSQLLGRLSREGLTVTVCNATRDESVATLEAYLRRLNVPLREASLSTATPSDVALLHEGEDLIAAGSVGAVAGAVDVVGTGDPPFDDDAYPELLRRLETDAYGTDRTTVDRLVDVSREIELQAWDAPGGEIHAGFQRLSNLTGDRASRRTYAALADAAVDVHLYGVPDAEVEGIDATVHGSGTDEVRDHWFVAFRSADGRRGATLVTKEVEPGVYEGSWTFDPAVADATIAYLRDRYG